MMNEQNQKIIAEIVAETTPKLRACITPEIVEIVDKLKEKRLSMGAIFHALKKRGLMKIAKLNTFTSYYYSFKKEADCEK